jgi:hypothetical protein
MPAMVEAAATIWHTHPVGRAHPPTLEDVFPKLTGHAPETREQPITRDDVLSLSEAAALLGLPRSTLAAKNVRRIWWARLRLPFTLADHLLPGRLRVLERPISADVPTISH